MSVSADQIRQALQDRLQPLILDVVDESAEHAGHAGSNGSAWGTHFRVRIGGPSFSSLTRVARHRLVYDAVQHLIDQGIHALAIDWLPHTDPQFPE